MTRPQFVLRTIKNGAVRIRGQIFRPNEIHRAYDGRLDGQRWAFGLYWGPPNYDKYDAHGFASFVSLWGSEAAYRGGEGTDWPGANHFDGFFHWEWWNAATQASERSLLGFDHGDPHLRAHH